MHSQTPRCARAWLQRSVAAALLAAGVVLRAAFGAFRLHDSAMGAAAIGFCGESIVCYGVMLAYELRRRGGRRALPAAMHDLAIEFGPAALLNTLFRLAQPYTATPWKHHATSVLHSLPGWPALLQPRCAVLLVALMGTSTDVGVCPHQYCRARAMLSSVPQATPRRYRHG